MILSRYWPLAILLLGWAGCSGTSPATTSGGKSAAELIESGNTALARGDADQALVDFNAALDAQPDSALARERRAAAFLQMKKFDQALYDSNEALKIDGKLASAYYTRGLVEKDLGDREKALDDFTKALDNGLARVEVLTARGALYHSMAKISVRPDEAAKILATALKDFDRAVKLDPGRAECHIQRAVIRLDMGDYEGAATDCDEALKADPNLAAAYVARARGECELSEIDKAILDCDSAIHLDEGLIEAYVIRGKARLEKSSEMRTLAEVAACDQAVDDCQKAIRRSAKFQGDADSMKHAKTMRGLAHELRGSIYQDLHLAKRALAEYERALSLDPYLVSTLLRRAVARTSVEDFGGALSDCNTAISIDSVRPDAYSGRGWVYTMKFEFPKAIEDFTQAVSLDPKCAKAFSGRAAVYSAMANEERRKIEQLARTKRPADHAEIVARLEKMQELWQKCIEDATEALRVNHHLAKAYLTRGLVYAYQEAANKALDDFNAAVREDPSNARAYYNRGVLDYKQFQLHAKLNNLEKAGKLLNAAITDFEEASKLQPKNAWPILRLGQCFAAKGDAILSNKYMKVWQERQATARQEQESFLDSFDFMVKRKPEPEPELRPDSDLEPLEKAKMDLEKKLDATAEE